MNDNHSPDSNDMVTSVKNAFDAMRMPPAPARQETLDAIHRAANSAGSDARAIQTTTAGFSPRCDRPKGL